MADTRIEIASIEPNINSAINELNTTVGWNLDKSSKSGNYLDSNYKPNEQLSKRAGNFKLFAAGSEYTFDHLETHALMGRRGESGKIERFEATDKYSADITTPDGKNVNLTGDTQEVHSYFLRNQSTGQVERFDIKRVGFTKIDGAEVKVDDRSTNLCEYYISDGKNGWELKGSVIQQPTISSNYAGLWKGDLTQGDSNAPEMFKNLSKVHQDATKIEFTPPPEFEISYTDTLKDAVNSSKISFFADRVEIKNGVDKVDFRLSELANHINSMLNFGHGTNPVGILIEVLQALPPDAKPEQIKGKIIRGNEQDGAFRLIAQQAEYLLTNLGRESTLNLLTKIKAEQNKK